LKINSNLWMQVTKMKPTVTKAVRVASTSSVQKKSSPFTAEARAKDYVYSAKTIQKYGLKTPDQIIQSKHISRSGDGWSDVPRVEEDGLRYYNRTYHDTGNTYYRAFRPYADMDDEALMELAEKRVEEVLNRMERIKDTPNIGVPDDPVAAIKRGEQPFGPDYVAPKFWDMSLEQLTEHFIGNFKMFRELDQEMNVLQNQYEAERELSTKQFNAQLQVWEEHFQALRDAQEPAEVSMAKAKRKEKEMIETFTRKLASGQMLSAHELMHFSMIDGAAMSRAMKLYEEKQQMSSQTVQRFSFRTHV